MRLKSRLYNLLRYTQKFTKTDNVYLAKGGFWLTLQKFSGFLSIISAIAFANLLSKETYGTYQYLLSMLGILLIPTLQSMKTAVTQAVSRGYEGSVIPAVRVKITWGILGSLGAIGLSSYYFLNENHTLASAFLMAGLFIPFLNPFSLYAAYLEGKKNFRLVSIYLIISQILSVSLMVLAVFATKNVLVIFFAYLIVHSLIAFAFFKITIKKFPPDKERDEKTIPFGIKVSLIKIVPTIARELDQILIWHFLGAAQVAVYSFAQKLPTQLSDNLGVLNQLAFPKMSAASQEDLKKNLPKKVMRLYAVIIPMGILYILLVPFVFEIFFSQYQESVIYAQIFSFFIFLFPLSFIGQTFEAKMQEKKIFITNTFLPVIRIFLMIILIPILGIWGAVLTRLLNSVIGNVLVTFLFFKK